MRRPDPRPPAATVLALALLLGAGAGGAAAASTALPSTAPPSTALPSTALPSTAPTDDPDDDTVVDGGDPDLEVVSVVPAELLPGGRVVVRGRVHGGDDGLTGARVEVRRAGSRSSSVSSLERWTAAVDSRPGPTADQAPFDDPADSARTALEVAVGDVPAGSSVPFTATLEAADSGLRDRESAAGAYGMQLLLLAEGPGNGGDGTEPEDALDDERGFLLWSPDVELEPTRLSTTLTLQGPPPTAGTGLPDPVELAALTAPAGRLTRLLEAAAALEADWVVDPVLLAGLHAAVGATPAPAPSPTGGGTGGTATGDATSDAAQDATPEPTTGLPTDRTTDRTTDPADDTTTERTTEPADDTGTGPAGAATTADPEGGPTTGDEETGDEETGDEETGDEETGDGAAGDGAAVWLDALGAARGGREVVLADWADPDPARLRSTDRIEDAWQTLHAAEAAALPPDLAEDLLAGRARTDVLVALGGPTTADDLLTLAQGRSSVLLPEELVPLTDPFALTYTPDAVSEVDAGSGRLSAVLSDASLSADTASALEGSPLALTRVLARLATTTLQRPNDPRLVAVALPADLDPAPGAAERVAEALARTRWAEPVPLTTALGTPPSDADRDALPRGRDPDVPGVQDLLDAVADGRRVAAATAAPQDPVVAAALDLRAAATLSRSADAGAAAELAAQLRAQTSGTVGAVQVVPGSRVTLVAAEAALPVTVVNDLDTEVTLVLEVRSRSPRLQVPETRVPVTVEPGQRAVVDVPVVAVASGAAEVSTQLVTADGRAWGPASTVSVTVATQAEGRVLAGIGVGVAVLFVLGAARAFVRNRRGRELDEVTSVTGVTGASGEQP